MKIFKNGLFGFSLVCAMILGGLMSSISLNADVNGTYKICKASSIVKVGHTYTPCEPGCPKVYDEKGKGNNSKCFISSSTAGGGNNN